MPADMQKLQRSKEAILNSISTRGPSLPIQIARSASLTLLFASAYLSELYNERKIKMSNMKVGSSSLYYLDGQEAKLENFVEHLNHKEREAFNRLRNEKLLEDDKMEPAIRVALRAIKDFAIPVRINLEQESKLFWKYYLINDEELKTIAQEKITGKKSKKEENKEKQEISEEKTDVQNKLEETQELQQKQPKVKEELKERQKEQIQVKKIDEIREKIELLQKEAEAIKEENTLVIKEKKKKLVEESKFIKDTKEFLRTRDIEVLNIIEEKKNTLAARVRVNTIFGKQEFYLNAKDKKKITEEDLIISLQKAQEEKMLALIIAPGEIDKKSLDYAKNYRNLLKFEKLKL